ncbi:hypothetical protein BB14905_03480 [Bacillus sp. B14905]|nr:hypothetical protein BB14905_03480 [Bacillus sp. B14905]
MKMILFMKDKEIQIFIKNDENINDLIRKAKKRNCTEQFLFLLVLR